MPLDWETDVRPVLDASYRVFVDVSAMGALPDAEIRPQSVSERLGRDSEDPRTKTALVYLRDNGYIRQTMKIDERPEPLAFVLTERALQLVAGWPSDAPDAVLSKILAAVDARIEAATTEDERTRWQRVREGFASFGRDVLVGVVSRGLGPDSPVF